MEEPALRPARRAQASGGAFARFLDVVERLGNLLPHPVALFAVLALLVVLGSAVAAGLGLAVPDPRPEGAPGRAEDGVIRAVSLVSAEGAGRIFAGIVPNFTGFAPLGVVMTAMLGIGVAEKSGLFSAAVRAIVLKAPPGAVTYAVVLAGILSNTASEMGYVVLVPLAAVVYRSLGRHPLAGMAAAFAGVSGGYSANLLIGTIDPLLAGITEEAARLIDPAYVVPATASWFFMAASVPLLTLAGGLVSLRLVEPRLGTFDPARADEALLAARAEPLSAREIRGLRAAGLAALFVFGLMALSIAPAWGVLRDPVTGDRLRSPFFSGFAVWILLFFLATGWAFGRAAGTVRTGRDVIDGMSSALSSLGLYLVIIFFAAQFVAFFGWSNLGPITAVRGAALLERAGLSGSALFLGFILVCALINLMIGSASAQWAMTAPVFVPMLMLAGWSPELIQTAYRIGDSVTNPITPMMSYFGLILAVAARWDRNIGIGTMIAMMLPYTLVFLALWSVFFLVWVFGLGLPVGPGAPLLWPPA